MARIRRVSYTTSSRKGKPKVAFFHNDNFDNHLEKMSNKMYYGKGMTVVALNKNQNEKYISKRASKYNNKVYRFHK